ncbi:MAG: hypothetical protein ACRDZY_22580, partial [Acidimicrobiales bacterium]
MSGGSSATSQLEADPGQPDLTTAMGRQQADAQNSQDNIHRLQAILDHDPSTLHADHIKQMISDLQASIPHALGGVLTEKGSGSGSGINDFGNAMAAGVAKGALVTPTMIAGQVAGIASHLPLIGDPLKKAADFLNSRAAENSARIDEDINPEGG